MPIEVRNLTYKYSAGMAFEKTALNDVSFKIEDGEFIGLIGHTGSGKSTLVQLLNGLLAPSDGAVLIDGVNIYSSKNLKQIRQKVGLIFQYPEYQLFEMTVYKDVAFGPTNLGLSPDEIDKRVKEALSIVQIPEELYDKSPFELSGGQKRRVAIAGVLSMNPSILILDEPTAGLDPKAKALVLEQIESMKGSRTIILISHIMDDIARLSDRIIVLKEGKIVISGPPKNVFLDASLLKSIGLSLTQSSEILLMLKNKGFNVDISMFTPDSAAEEIFRVLKAAKLPEDLK